MKRILAIILALVLCCSMLSITAMATEGAANLSVQSVTAKRGETVTIAVGLYNNPGIGAMDLAFTYDTERLDFVEAKGVGMGGGQWYTEAGVPGAVWDSGSDSTYTGNIVLLTFKVKDNAAYGTAAVSAICQSAACWATESRVTVGGATGGITITHDHVWGDWEVIEKATCTEDGSKIRYCTVEGCTESETAAISALGHEYDEKAWSHNNKQHWHVCTRCGEEVGHAAHVMDYYDDPVPTDVIDGLRHHYCKICSYEYDEVLPFEDVDPVPGTYDLTPIVMAATAMAAISMLAAAAYVLKRKAVK